MSRGIKFFTVELRDLSSEKDDWMLAKVFYTIDEIDEIEDEVGRTYQLSSLSQHDQEIVVKALIEEVMANRSEIPSGGADL
jgi:quinolinate synthase